MLDQGVEAGTAFLVMELVPGGTLRELLDERGPMPPFDRPGRRQGATLPLPTQMRYR